MQKAKQNYFKDRSIYYSTFPIQQQAEIANYSELEYQAYEHSLKIYRDLKNSMDTAFSDGKIEGKAEGELKAKLETATNLKQMGMTSEVIAQATGLSLEEIEAL